MEIFIIAIGSIGIVVIAYAYSFARRILELREEQDTPDASSSLAFWFPNADPPAHPVSGAGRYAHREVNR